MKHIFRGVAITTIFSLMATFIFGFDVLPASAAAPDRTTLPPQDITSHLSNVSPETRREINTQLGNFNAFSPNQRISQFAIVQGTVVSVPSSTNSGLITLNVLWQWPVATTTVQPLTITVTPQTSIFNNGWKTIPLGSFTVGDSIQTLIRKDNNGNDYRALLVKNTSLTDKKTENGTIMSLNPGNTSFGLGSNGPATSTTNKIITVTPTTEFKMTPTTTLNGFDDLKIGQKITVQGITNTRTQSLIATTVRIKKDTASTPLPTASERGFITGLDIVKNQFILASPTLTTITVDSDTKYVGPTGWTLQLSDLSNANLVEVTGNWSTDMATISAQQIKVIYYQAPDQPITFKGQITSINVGQRQLNVTTVNSPSNNSSTIALVVTGETVIVDGRGAPRSLSELMVGDQLAINGWLEGSGLVIPSLIADTSLYLMSEYATGSITAINGTDSFTLVGTNKTYTVKTANSTTYRLFTNNSGTFSNLMVGNKVTVYGTMNDQANYINASSVGAVNPLPYPSTPSSTAASTL